MSDFRAVFPEDAMKNCVFKAIILKGNADLVVFDNAGTDLNAHNVNDAIVELNDKIGHATDDYYTKEETDEKLALKADESELANYYTKSESDTLLAEKADASSVYTKTETDDLLAVKADKTDLEDFYTKSQADALLGAKADASSVYTKTETDDLLSAKADASSVYTKSEADELLNAKVDETALESDYYDKDDVDSLLSAKANASNVYTKAETDAEISALIDDAHIANNKAWSSEKISKEIYDILPSAEATDAIANFNTSLVLPLIDVKAEIKAVETGTGAKSPSNPYVISGFTGVNLYQRGANLWDEQWEVGSINPSTGENASDNTRIRSKNLIAVKPNATLYICGIRCSFFLYAQDGSYIGTYSSGSFFGPDVTFTVPANAYFIRFIGATSYGTTYNNDISINYPSTDTDYHAYNPNSNVTLINLGGTYYGGYVEQDKDGKRELVVTHEIVDLGNLTWRLYTGTHPYWWSDDLKPVIKKASVNSEVMNITCSCFDKTSSISISNGSATSGIAIHTDGAVRIVYPDMPTIQDDLISEIGGNNLSYPLAEPFTVALSDGEPIIAFNGVNNVWSDTNGDTTVKYKLSIEEYVANKIAEITNSNRSLNTSLLRGSEELREDEALPLSDELAREAITEPERDDSQR